MFFGGVSFRVVMGNSIFRSLSSPRERNEDVLWRWGCCVVCVVVVGVPPVFVSDASPYLFLRRVLSPQVPPPTAAGTATTLFNR